MADARIAVRSWRDVQTFITDPPYNLGFDYGSVSDALPPADYEAMLGEVLDVSFEAAREGPPCRLMASIGE